MSQFVLEGRLGVGNALVGTFRKDEQSPDQTVIVALIPPATPLKKVAEIKEQIHLHAQQHFVPWVPGQEPSVTALFNRLNAHQLSFAIKNERPAARLVEDALAQGKPKNVIFCTSPAVYLSVCSKLGISKQDMAHISELNPLLPQPQRFMPGGGVVGQAHKICEMLNANKIDTLAKIEMHGIKIPMPLDPREAQLYIAQIQRAAKFSAGNMTREQFHAKFGETIRDVTHGQRKIYLPNESCLFEINVDGRRTFLLAHTKKGSPWRPYNHELGDEDFFILPMVVEPGSDKLKVYPYNVVNHVENGVAISSLSFTRSGGTPELESAMKEVMQAHLDSGEMEDYIHQMLAMLSVFNSPSHAPRISQVPEALQRSRHKSIQTGKTKYPFYEYHVIDVPDLDKREENLSTTETIRRYSDAEPGSSGIHQRHHLREAYFRDVVRNGQPTTIRVGDYWAGDPELGFIAKSKRVRLQEAAEAKTAKDSTPTTDAPGSDTEPS